MLCEYIKKLSYGLVIVLAIDVSSSYRDDYLTYSQLTQSFKMSIPQLYSIVLTVSYIK